MIVNADPTDMSLPSKASSQHNQPSHHNHFFSDAGLGTDLLHTAKPAITANPAVNHVSSAIPGVTHPHMMDSFHTHGPHDLAHGPVHSHSNQVSQDNLHHPPHTHDLQHADIGFTKSISQTKIPTMKKQATTAAPVPKKAASDQMNLIVGDWSGAEQSLTGPPPHPPPKRDLALEHPHGHHHFDSHVHGFRAPSIPPPPPLSQMAPSILPVNKHPVSQRIDIHPANQPVDSQNIDIHPAIQPADIHPADQPVDMHPVSQRIDIHSASQPVDIHPANQPVDSQKIDIHPGSQPVDIHSANQLVDSQKIDIHPGSQPVDIHPANQPVDPASQRIDIHSASQSVDIHPASQPVNIHTASQPDNIHPTNASVKQSSATEHIELSPVATGNNNAGITDLTAVNTNLPDPNTGHSVHDPLHSINEHAHSAHDLGHSVHGLGHSVHDLGLSFNDPGHSVHDPGLSGHDPGHNLGPGNLKGLNYSFINVLDKNLNQHIGKYKSALVYLYDPFKATLKQGSGLDIVEIALNLTDLPLHANASSSNHESHTQNGNADLSKAMPIISQLNKVYHHTNNAPDVFHSNYDVSIPVNLNQTQIDSNNSGQILKQTTPALTPIAGATTSNDSKTVISVSKNQSTVSQNVTTRPVEVVMSGMSPNQSASVNETVAANSTAPTTESALFTTDVTTAIGPTTVDPDYLADLAEAQEEAAQMALELAEAGGMTTAGMTTAGATPNSMTAATASVNKNTTSATVKTKNIV